MSHRERDLQDAIMDQLAIHGWRAEAYKPEKVAAVHGQPLRGVLALGHPDIVAFKGWRLPNFETPGVSVSPTVRALLIEVKTPMGVVSDDQKQYHRTLAVWGIPVHVVRSMEDLWALLEAAGETVKRVTA